MATAHRHGLRPRAVRGIGLDAAEGLLAGCCAAAAATALAVAAGGTRHLVLGAVIVAAGVLTAAVRQRPPAAFGTAVFGWLCFDGFVIGRHAVLGWDGTLEWWWLAAMLAAAACGLVLGRFLASPDPATVGAPEPDEVAGSAPEPDEATVGAEIRSLRDEREGFGRAALSCILYRFIRRSRVLLAYAACENVMRTVGDCRGFRHRRADLRNPLVYRCAFLIRIAMSQEDDD